MGCPKLLAIVLLCTAKLSIAQDDSSRLDKLISFPDKVFGTLDKKTKSIEDRLSKQTDKYLSKLQRQENKLRRKLWRKDSSLAKQLFDGADKKYKQLKNTTGTVNKYASVYSGHLDSLTTALNFLKSNNLKNTSLSYLESNPELQKTLDHYTELQSKLNASDQIRRYLLQRQQLLKEQFEQLGMVKELRQFRKQVYYYQAQVREYKQAFEDPNKLEEKLLTLAQKIPQFKEFFAKNSLLGSLFALPGTSTYPTASLAGLQTRFMVNQSIQNRFGSGSNVTQQLQQNVQNAQGQLNQLKNKINSFSSGSYGSASDGDLPEFKPNQQKTKSFLKRLEYGTNIQSQRANYFFPVTSDIGLSVGYKLNDKSIIGIGASYKLGLGRGWNDINLSSQGVGLRSFMDWKIKGSFYMSGGYEQNYRTLINSIDQLKNYSAWQSSGLLGISKKYSLKGKMKGEMKLLWDFLSYQQVPRTQAIIFRVGYNIH